MWGLWLNIGQVLLGWHGHGPLHSIIVPLHSASQGLGYSFSSIPQTRSRVSGHAQPNWKHKFYKPCNPSLYSPSSHPAPQVPHSPSMTLPILPSYYCSKLKLYLLKFSSHLCWTPWVFVVACTFGKGLAFICERKHAFISFLCHAS